jgi:hypothetical protein
MGALPPVNKVCRIDLHHKIGNDTNVMNRFFLRYSGTLSQGDAQTWVGTIRSQYQAAGHPLALMTQDVFLNRTVLTDLSSNTSPQAEDDNIPQGPLSPPAVPAAVAMVIKFRIARRYRGGHNRIYVPGLPAVSLTSPNTWSNSSLTNMVGAWQAFVLACETGAPVAAGTIDQVTVSYFQGFTNVTFPSGRTRPVPKLRTTPPVVDSVIAINGNGKTGSQRRRNLQSA